MLSTNHQRTIPNPFRTSQLLLFLLKTQQRVWSFSNFLRKVLLIVDRSVRYWQHTYVSSFFHTMHLAIHTNFTLTKYIHTSSVLILLWIFICEQKKRKIIVNAYYYSGTTKRRIEIYRKEMNERKKMKEIHITECILYKNESEWSEWTERQG